MPQQKHKPEKKPKVVPEKQARSRALPEGFRRAQFKPGVSGNPAGRPKYKTITESLRALLERTERKGGPTVAEILSAVMIKKAKGGYVPAFTAIADRAEGKPSQPITGANGGPLEINFAPSRAIVEEQITALMKQHRCSREDVIKKLGPRARQVLGESE